LFQLLYWCVMFENIVLQWIILKWVKWKVIKMCLCSNWTVCVKQNTNVRLSGECSWSCLLAGRVVLPVVRAVKTEAWAKSRMKLNSCAHPQKQRLVGGYVHTFCLTWFLYFLWHLGISQVQGWSHFMRAMTS
jgi:hypothetical protein